MNDRNRQVEEFAREWASAEERGDAAFLEGALTDDFIGVGAAVVGALRGRTLI
jgi:hypothetical protein